MKTSTSFYLSWFNFKVRYPSIGECLDTSLDKKVQKWSSEVAFSGDLDA